jgi:hypothetical protein
MTAALAVVRIWAPLGVDAVENRARRIGGNGAVVGRGVYLVTDGRWTFAAAVAAAAAGLCNRSLALLLRWVHRASQSFLTACAAFVAADAAAAAEAAYTKRQVEDVMRAGPRTDCRRRRGRQWYL